MIIIVIHFARDVETVTLILLATRPGSVLDTFARFVVAEETPVYLAVVTEDMRDGCVVC